MKKKNKGILITSKMIKQWTSVFQEKPTHAVLKEAFSAFRAAVQQAGSEKEHPTKYRVEGSIVFNAVIRLCLTEVVPALQTLLGLPPLTEIQQPMSNKNKKWTKLKVEVKGYLTDLLQLLRDLSDPTTVNAILKHAHKLVVFFTCFPKLTKILLKKMISMWSTGEEVMRVMAFLVINKILQLQRDIFLESGLKQMYMAYVKNAKFTSPTTLPLINFMQRSLVEVFLLDQVLAYQYAFVYIRQLAIHLRNAITVKKKENCQAVYNWQFVHCLELWVRLLTTAHPSPVLQPLVYPLTQTIIGTIKLLPTARYFPLRFHCVRTLTTLSEATDVFIPVLPFLLEVLEQTDFNKKHKSIRAKPFNFACILKLTKTQFQEKVFKDGILDQLHELLMDQFSVHAHKLSFPELVLPAVLQLKDFLKKCKVANYCKQVKQVVDKVTENAKFITDKRKSVTFSLADTKAADEWERRCKEEGTPLGKYYATWRKLRDRELMHLSSARDQIVDVEEIETVERPKRPQKASKEERESFAELMARDSGDSDDDTRFLLKSERPRAGQKKSQQKDDSDEEDYSDFDSDELEQLAGSADESSDDEEDGDDDGEDESSEDDEDGENGGPPAKKLKTSVASNRRKPKSSDDEDDDVVEDFVMSDSD